MAKRRPGNAHDWHGHRIITEDELIRAQHQLADEPAYRRRRFRHGVILGLLAAVLVAALFGAYMVKTSQWVIPAFEPKPSVAAPAVHLTCPTQDLDYVRPQQVRVNVLNGTGTPGLAGATATLLKKRDFRIGKTGNHSLADPDVVAVVMSGPKGYGPALSVQRHFKGSVFVPDPENTGTTVDLVLGARYKKMTAVKKVDTKPGKLRCPEPAPKEPAKPESSGAKASTPGT